MPTNIPRGWSMCNGNGKAGFVNLYQPLKDGVLHTRYYLTEKGVQIGRASHFVILWSSMCLQ